MPAGSFREADLLLAEPLRAGRAAGGPSPADAWETCDAADARAAPDGWSTCEAEGTADAAPPAPPGWDTCEPPQGEGEGAAALPEDCGCAHCAPAPALAIGVERTDAPAEQSPAPAAGCARDVAVTDTVALLHPASAPLPVTAAERRRVAGHPGALEDYRAVFAAVPAAPEPRLLVFFHGNDNFVTVGPGGTPRGAVARVPRWVDAPPPPAAATRARIAATSAAPLRYGLDALAAAQGRLAAPAVTALPVKDPVVLAPEDAERTEGRFWSVPPRGQYGAHDDATAAGSGTTRLEALVNECYEHLRCLRTPTGRAYLPAEGAGGRPAWLSNVQRLYLGGHSGGGKPLVEAAGADLAIPSPTSMMGAGGKAAELWLFDCTYGFGTHNYRSFCERWRRAGKLARAADGARLVCVYRPRTPESDTETEADALRGILARLLGVSADGLRKLHDSADLDSRSMRSDVLPALLTAPVVFVRTHVAHDRIPTAFTPLLLRTAAS